MDVVAQWARTVWTKESRGGEGAARRNAAPVGFRLPATDPPLVHTVVMDERDGFEPAESLEYGEPDRSRVHLKQADGRLVVSPVLSPLGLPQRTWRPAAVWLAPGEWVRWQVNYRFGGAGDWTYRLDTLNLAFGTVTADVFTGTPSRHVDERAILR